MPSFSGLLDPLTHEHHISQAAAAAEHPEFPIFDQGTVVPKESHKTHQKKLLKTLIPEKIKHLAINKNINIWLMLYI